MRKIKGKKRISSVIVIMAIALFYTINPQESHDQHAALDAYSTSMQKKDQKTKLQRSIASVPSFSDKEKHRPLESKVAQQIKDKVSHKWQETLKDNLLKNLEEGVELDIQVMQATTYMKNQKSFAAQKVLIKMNSAQGHETSYHALVDARTGSIINTWNHTRFEIRQPLSLTPDGTIKAQE